MLRASMRWRVSWPEPTSRERTHDGLCVQLLAHADPRGGVVCQAPLAHRFLETLQQTKTTYGNDERERHIWRSRYTFGIPRVYLLKSMAKHWAQCQLLLGENGPMPKLSTMGSDTVVISRKVHM